MGKLEIASIQLGEQIPGTDLVKRWQAGMEIMPAYIGPEKLASQAVDAATEQATKAGYHSVVVMDVPYVLIGGEWYTFSL